MRYRKISIQIWNDEKFRALPDDGKLAFIYILTHPHMTGIGAMRATEAGLAAELGWSSERLREGLSEAFAKGLLKADWDACLLVAPNFIKHNTPESPNVVRCWFSMFDTIPQCELQREHFQHVKAFTEGLPDSLRKAFGNSHQGSQQVLAKDSQSLSEESAKSSGRISKSFAYQEQEQDLNTTTTKVIPHTQGYGGRATARDGGGGRKTRPTATAKTPEPGGDGGGGDAAAGGNGGGGAAPVGDIVARLSAAAGDQAKHDARAAEAVARIASTSSAPAKGGGPPTLDSVERIAAALKAEPSMVADLVRVRGLEFVAQHAGRLLASTGVRNPMGALVRLCHASAEKAAP